MVASPEASTAYEELEPPVVGNHAALLTNVISCHNCQDMKNTPFDMAYDCALQDFYRSGEGSCR